MSKYEIQTGDDEEVIIVSGWDVFKPIIYLWLGVAVIAGYSGYQHTRQEMLMIKLEGQANASR